MPLALLPASATPVTAPFAARVTAPMTTLRTTFFALRITPGAERFLLDFLLELFFADREDPDVFATELFLALFDGMCLSSVYLSARNRAYLCGVNSKIKPRIIPKRN